MTQNQIAYQRLQEDMRHNREDESIQRQRNKYSLIGHGLSAGTSLLSTVVRPISGLVRGGR